MALCHKWDVKNDFAYVLQFFPLISDGLGSVTGIPRLVRFLVPSKPHYWKNRTNRTLLVISTKITILDFWFFKVPFFAHFYYLNLTRFFLF